MKAAFGLRGTRGFAGAATFFFATGFGAAAFFAGAAFLATGALATGFFATGFLAAAAFATGFGAAAFFAGAVFLAGAAFLAGAFAAGFLVVAIFEPHSRKRWEIAQYQVHDLYCCVLPACASFFCVFIRICVCVFTDCNIKAIPERNQSKKPSRTPTFKHCQRAPGIMPFRLRIIFIIPPPLSFFIIDCICSNCDSIRLTSCTCTPAPAAIRRLRDALMRSGLVRS